MGSSNSKEGPSAFKGDGTSLLIEGRLWKSSFRIEYHYLPSLVIVAAATRSPACVPLVLGSPAERWTSPSLPPLWLWGGTHLESAREELGELCSAGSAPLRGAN